jgi:parvulin-like peptidyl-prolyl isomerase
MDKIAASHILIMHNESRDSRSELSKSKAKDLITDIHKKLVKDKKLFKDLASKHSDCSSSTYGGSLGEFGKGVMVKTFEDKAFSLDVDEISEPVETEFGFHLIKRDS